MKFTNLEHLNMKNYKYLISFNGLGRILQIGFLIGLNISILMTSLSFSCKIFVYIASGLVFVGSSSWLSSNVLQPKRHNLGSTRWQEGLHDALSALILLVIATVLLFQDLSVPIGVAVFFSLSCALCCTVQGYGNFSSGRQNRIEKYLGKYQLFPQQDDVCLTDVAVKKSHRTFTITSADDDEDEDDLPLPTITVHHVDEEMVTDGTLAPEGNISTLITGVGGTPEPSDRSGMSDYHTPQETPSGHSNVARVAAAGTRPSPTPWDPTAFSTSPDEENQLETKELRQDMDALKTFRQTPNTPTVPVEEPLIDVGAFVGSPDITFNIKPMNSPGWQNVLNDLQ